MGSNALVLSGKSSPNQKKLKKAVHAIADGLHWHLQHVGIEHYLDHYIVIAYIPKFSLVRNVL